LLLIITGKKKRWREFAGYLVTLILFGFLPLILYVLGISNVIWTAAMSALNAFITAIGLLIFAKKTLRNEVFRKFNF
jgi:MFS superfamily sulfate permease-like transporter